MKLHDRLHPSDVEVKSSGGYAKFSETGAQPVHCSGAQTASHDLRDDPETFQRRGVGETVVDKNSMHNQYSKQDR